MIDAVAYYPIYLFIVTIMSLSAFYVNIQIF